MVQRVRRAQRCPALQVGLLLLLVAVRIPGQEPVSGACVREGFGHVYCGSRLAGEARLHSLAREALREDAWLFADDVWIDVGYDERADSVLCSWESFRSVTGIRTATGLIWYHLHPLASAPTGVHPPSVEDVLALALLKDLCEAELGAELVGRVFDGCGVWDMDLSDELRGKLKRPAAASTPPPGEDRSGPGAGPGASGSDPRDVASLLLCPVRRRDLAALAFYLEHERRAREILGNDEMGRAETIARYVKQMADIGLLLRYTAWPPESPAAR